MKLKRIAAMLTAAVMAVIRPAPFAWPDWSITYPIGRRRCQTKEVHLNQRLATTNQRIDKEVLYP